MSVKTAVTTLVLTGVSFIEASAAVSYQNVSVSAISSTPEITIVVASGAGDVAFVEPTFDAIYLEPKFAATYLEVDVVAVPSKPAVIQVDVVNPLDSKLFGVDKVFTDSITAPDSHTTDFDGVLDDQVYFAETFVPLKVIIRLFEDEFTTPDAVELGFGVNKSDFVSMSDDEYVDFLQSLSDSVVPGESYDVVFTKIFDDSITALEQASVDFSRPLSDIVTPGDVFVRVVDFQRFIDSAVSMVEFANADFSKPLDDSVSPTTFKVVDITTPRQDSFILTDDFLSNTLFSREFLDQTTETDFSDYFVGKNLFDVVNMLDNTAFNIGAVTDDSITFDDQAFPVFPVLRDFTDLVTMNEYLSELNDTQINEIVVNGKYGGEIIYIALVRYAPPVLDTTTISDSGMWALQDYNSQDYFLSDYVGTKGSI